MQLPVIYHDTPPSNRRLVRLEYLRRQHGKCWFCEEDLGRDPGQKGNKEIDHRLFPPNFFKHPVHLHHDHKTGLTIGAVHAKCNAILWQYYGK